MYPNMHYNSLAGHARSHAEAGQHIDLALDLLMYVTMLMILEYAVQGLFHSCGGRQP